MSSNYPKREIRFSIGNDGGSPSSSELQLSHEATSRAKLFTENIWIRGENGHSDHSMDSNDKTKRDKYLSMKIGDNGMREKLMSEVPVHEPHDLFVELDELGIGDGNRTEWQQSARWIKYEEDIEEGTDRWGNPHVAGLSFHSLLQLRACLQQGVMMMDMMATPNGMVALCENIVSELVRCGRLDKKYYNQMLTALLLKHRHVGDGDSTLHKSSATADLTKLLSRKESSDQKHIEGEKKQGHMSRKESRLMSMLNESSEASSVLIGQVDFLSEPILIFIRLAEACELGNVNEISLPIRFFFILVGPRSVDLDYHEIGRSIATLMSNDHFHRVAYQTNSRQLLLNAIDIFLDDSIVLPPGEYSKKMLFPLAHMAKNKHDMIKPKKDTKDFEDKKGEDDGLLRTGRCFGGLVKDVRRRYAQYASDIKDALCLQCFSTIVFIYFACLAPAVTFGGLLSEKTSKLIGVREMLISTAAGGVLFSLLAGQPLMILGATGPMVIFEEAMYQVCERIGVDFLAFRFWVGVWVAGLSVFTVAVEGSYLISYCTRFTEEIFASLVSLIFLYEVFVKLAKVFVAHPLKRFYPPPNWAPIASSLEQCHLMFPTNWTTIEMSSVSSLHTSTATADLEANNSSLWSTLVAAGSVNVNVTDMIDADTRSGNMEPNTALLSLVLCLGTFFIAFFLRQFRNSHFLGHTARRAIGDFGIPLSIIVMAVIDLIIDDTFTEKLDVPPLTAAVNGSAAQFVVQPMAGGSLPVWALGAALVAALLLYILIFMETLITEMIINRKERHLVKGSSYHLDLLLMGVFTFLCGLTGLPFLNAATVRSISHVSALTTYSRKHAPGEVAPLTGVREQRVTAFCVHALIGVSVFFGPALQHLPTAVLFGIFLYMGISSLGGIQLFQRLRLLFMPTKHHPTVAYVRKLDDMEPDAVNMDDDGEEEPDFYEQAHMPV